MKRSAFLLSLFVSISLGSFAQIIPVVTRQNALVFQVNPNKDLQMVYLGEKLANQDEYGQIPGLFNQSGDYTGLYNSAYTSSGTRNLLEPAISVTHWDGNNSLDLQYVSHQVEKISDDISLLKIVLKDRVYPFQVTMYVKSYFAEDVIEQWTEITHQEKKSVTLHKYASANLSLKSSAFYLTQYHGDWAKEMHPEESKLTHGIKTLDSKLGTRANLFQPSFFMLSMGKPASEDEGEVLYGMMEWSGNFKIDMELDPQDNLRLIAGINNYASDYSIVTNQTFKTPAFLYVLSQNGKGEASRKIQAWARNHKLLDGKGNRLTLLNNWEATGFGFDEQKLFSILKDTKKLGVDLFLLDDGWFGNKYPRNSDNAGLGDWQANRAKLPNGVASLVKEAGATGVKFGIWVEPEMVNPASDLYHQHPDWVIKQPNRGEYYFRNQLVLDLSNPKVQDFVFGVIDGLFRENPDLAYIKWDCNAVIYNAYSAHLQNQSHLYVDYVNGLYNVLKRIRDKYPTVPMMLCSGGGGRVDYAALQYFTEFWPSDNTDPLERVFMQWEYSYFFPSMSMSCHVTDWGRQPLKYKVDVAMMGKMGFDIVVDRLSENDLKFCQQAVGNYNQLKDIIWHGDQYRLVDPKSNDFASLMYVDSSKQKAVVFNYLVNNRYDVRSVYPVKMKGLNPDQKYSVQEVNLYPGTQSALDSQKVLSGDFLMRVGYNPRVDGSRQSVILLIEEAK
ncbi:MAG: alpha-galactosidase [Bacteroidota bacterium]|nr:alpha-galactosidase [Bacteroidota bacterium]MDP4268550.1 alpha-galactosidase [Bacteroidota bacterium]